MLHRDECVARLAAMRAGTSAHFEVAGSQTLEVRLDGRVWAKQAAFFAYDGEFEFDSACLHHDRDHQPTAVRGGARLMLARGTGKLYLTDADRQVVVLDLDLDLDGDEVAVRIDSLLAFTPTVCWHVCPSHPTAHDPAATVCLAGSGPVALAVPTEATQSRVRPDKTTVADSPKSAASGRTFSGRGGDGPVSLRVGADGEVTLLPKFDVRSGLPVPSNVAAY